MTLPMFSSNSSSHTIFCLFFAVGAVIALGLRKSHLSLALAISAAFALMLWTVRETGHWGAAMPLRLALIPLAAAIVVLLMTRLLDKQNRQCKPALAVLLAFAVLYGIMDRTTSGDGLIVTGLAMVPLAAAVIVASVTLLRKVVPQIR